MIPPVSAAPPARPALTRPQAAPLPPVVLVHGIYDTSVKMTAIARSLRAQGRDVRLVELIPNNAGIPLEQMTPQIDRVVQQARRDSGFDKVDLVGFSMGGLISRDYLQAAGGDAYVRRCVFISTPNHGTLTGYFNWHPGGEEMRPGSAFLADLNSRPLPHTPILNLWTPLDLMIFPAINCKLAGVPNESFVVPLHPLMVYDGRVIARIGRFLSTPD